ncbi:Type III flagellar switch regulator (C-ring) FliN C-term [Loktanella sp. DSM 29012]|uniref:FliM/FliN family flagellar motor switch protein n=1 Tax=Loktanella sp. DSM 29012 TaxID=1881056 RepID=UPI0008B5B6BA|nr:FliM/FliN family flagellar motor switch protein [Loktanella sp. DSM 29012]SEP93914.1 Type III flagellar switch regulator (C-ring) FliN C-term [Loktanella sp. DSM 29012]
MTGVLHRMVRRQQADAPDVPLTASRAVKLSVTRVAQSSVGLVVDVTGVADRTCDLDSVTTDLSPDVLMLGVERDGTCVGMMICDASLIAATLETITTGGVSAQPAPLRAITETDADLVRPLLQALLNDLAATTQGTVLDGWAVGCRLSVRFSDARAACFALREQSYRVIVITVSDQKTDRLPCVTIALPDTVGPVPEHVPQSQVAADWADRLRAAVLGAPARLDVVVHRMPVPLRRLTSLAVGDCLPLTGFAVGSVRVEAPGGQLIATGRLGHVSGRIAVRIGGEAPPHLMDLPHGALVQLGRDVAISDATLIA